MDDLLDDFKSRVRIQHSTEDPSLTKMLQTSEKAVAGMVGFDDLNDLEFRELVIERTRFIYYDEGEYFEDNFHSELVRLGLRGAVSEKTIPETES